MRTGGNMFFSWFFSGRSFLLRHPVFDAIKDSESRAQSKRACTIGSAETHPVFDAIKDRESRAQSKRACTICSAETHPIFDAIKDTKKSVFANSGILMLLFPFQLPDFPVFLSFGLAFGFGAARFCPVQEFMQVVEIPPEHDADSLGIGIGWFCEILVV